MENIIQPVRPGGMASGRRVVALVAALALLLGGFVLMSEKADAASGPSVVAAADGGAVASVGTAQVDVDALIRAIVCPILNRLATTLPPFVAGIINALRARFGCVSP